VHSDGSKPRHTSVVQGASSASELVLVEGGDCGDLLGTAGKDMAKDALLYLGVVSHALFLLPFLLSYRVLAWSAGKDLAKDAPLYLSVVSHASFVLSFFLCGLPCPSAPDP
jgi:hypothetical protein